MLSKRLSFLASKLKDCRRVPSITNKQKVEVVLVKSQLGEVRIMLCLILTNPTKCSFTTIVYIKLRENVRKLAFA